MYLFKGGIDVYFYRGSSKSLLVQKHKPALTRSSASVTISEPHFTADVCSVNYLSINGKSLIFESDQV